MSQLTIKIYGNNDILPSGLSEENIFHSPSLFKLIGKTSRMSPYMVVAIDSENHVVAQLLAHVRFRSSWLPPYLYRHCRIFGEGYYHPSIDSEVSIIFGQMLEKLKSKLGKTILYIEVSNLPEKMFAYRQFRENAFFPVRWMNIHNSLHSHAPEERITPRMQRQIDAAYKQGVVTEEVKTDDDMKAFLKLLHHHHWLKPKRYIPADDFFKNLRKEDAMRLFITRYKQHVIGCSAVIYSQQEAYLWYSAFRRKSFAFVHPDLLTIWHAIKDAHQRGFNHISFMDVGLPFRKNSYRKFILRFGGKPTSTYRWFYFSLGWANRVLAWFYRD